MFPDQTGRKVDVEIAGQRADRGGIVDTGRFEYGLPRAVALDHVEAGLAGAFGDRRISLDDRYIMAFLPKHAGGSKANTADSNDNRLHVAA
jgi:hypothetical protein